MHKIKYYQYEYETTLPLSFHDCDAMGIVWHGNYLKFFETAREGLLGRHGIDYQSMHDSGFIYPVIEQQIRYRKAVSVYAKSIRVRAYLLEIFNRIKLGYEVYEDQQLCAYGYTIQVAVKEGSQELNLVTPACFVSHFADFKEA